MNNQAGGCSGKEGRRDDNVSGLLCSSERANERQGCGDQKSSGDVAGPLALLSPLPRTCQDPRTRLSEGAPWHPPSTPVSSCNCWNT